MKANEILEEIYRVREEHARECGYNIDVMFARMREDLKRLEAEGWKIVRSIRENPPKPRPPCVKSRPKSQDNHDNIHFPTEHCPQAVSSADIPVGFTDAEFLIAFVLPFRTDQSGGGRLPVQGQTGPRSLRINLLLRRFSHHLPVWRATSFRRNTRTVLAQGKQGLESSK